MSQRSKRNYKECGLARVEKYQGKRAPRCNGGSGCNRCWAKFDAARREQAVNGIAHEGR